MGSDDAVLCRSSCSRSWAGGAGDRATAGVPGQRLERLELYTPFGMDQLPRTARISHFFSSYSCSNLDGNDAALIHDCPRTTDIGSDCGLCALMSHVTCVMNQGKGLGLQVN